MKNNKSHSVKHSPANPVGNFVRHLVVRDVSPPYKHIGAVQNLLPKSALRHIESCGFNVKFTAFPEHFSNSAVYAVRVNRRYFFFLFVNKFIPDEHVDFMHNFILS